MRQPLCPGASESTSFCAVRNGLETDPELESEPEGDATKAHEEDDDASAETTAREPVTATAPATASAPRTERIIRLSCSSLTRHEAYVLR
jgi:hypothetical protein